MTGLMSRGPSRWRYIATILVLSGRGGGEGEGEEDESFPPGDLGKLWRNSETRVNTNTQPYSRMQTHKVTPVQICTSSHWLIVLHRERESRREDINSPLGVKWTRQHKDTVTFTHKKDLWETLPRQRWREWDPIKMGNRGGEKRRRRALLSCSRFTWVNTVLIMRKNNAEYTDCK